MLTMAFTLTFFTLITTGKGQVSLDKTFGRKEGSGIFPESFLVQMHAGAS